MKLLLKIIVLSFLANSLYATIKPSIYVFIDEDKELGKLTLTVEDMHAKKDGSYCFLENKKYEWIDSLDEKECKYPEKLENQKAYRVVGDKSLVYKFPPEGKIEYIDTSVFTEKELDDMFYSHTFTYETFEHNIKYTLDKNKIDIDMSGYASRSRGSCGAEEGVRLSLLIDDVEILKNFWMQSHCTIGVDVREIAIDTKRETVTFIMLSMYSKDWNDLDFIEVPFEYFKSNKIDMLDDDKICELVVKRYKSSMRKYYAIEPTPEERERYRLRKEREKNSQ